MPYAALRVELDCGHPLLYAAQVDSQAPVLCGLCFFREGWESELPNRLHQYKTLADNGNPETSPKFLAHMFLAMGLVKPPRDETLKEFRRKRGSIRKMPPRVREIYTEPAPGLFPVASSLWKLVGFQPPLGIVLVRAVNGASEPQIARELEISLMNVYIRMSKAIRIGMGFIPHVKLEAGAGSDHSS